MSHIFLLDTGGAVKAATGGGEGWRDLASIKEGDLWDEYVIVISARRTKATQTGPN